MMKIFIYSNETGEQVDSIEGLGNRECEQLALQKYGCDDYHWSYVDVPVSNAV
jgi:hypothetical protein